MRRKWLAIWLFLIVSFFAQFSTVKGYQYLRVGYDGGLGSGWDFPSGPCVTVETIYMKTYTVLVVIWKIGSKKIKPASFPTERPATTGGQIK